MQKPQDIEEKIQYRYKELRAVLPYLVGIKGDLPNELTIEVVKSVFDKSNRTFRDYVALLRNKSPEVVGLFRSHLSSLRRYVRLLRGFESLENSPAFVHARVEDEINDYVAGATEDAKGIMDCYDRILSKPSA